MIHYCVEVWGGQQIQGDRLYWPVFGSFDDCVCQALNVYVNAKEPFCLEESEYPSFWIGSGNRDNLYPLKEKGGEEKLKKKNQELEVPTSLPPYILPTAPSGPSNSQSSGESDSDVDPIIQGPVTRSRTRRQGQESQKSESVGGLHLLREISMGGPQPEMGYVAVPINSGDVRDFKKEMGSLLEDPLGVAERVDQFLGPNVYTWEEVQSILGILFTSEERGMIRRAGM